MSAMHKKASSANELATAQQIMEKIRTEDPSYWPYGLETSAFDGGLWLVSKSASHQPIGFVGWQNRIREQKKVGYYVIGILPEYRNQGFAKQAVAEVIRMRAPECDEVRALIMEHNAPSKALGRALSVPIEEVPMRKAAGTKLDILKTLAGMTLTPTLLDVAVNKDKGAIGHYLLNREGADPWAGADFILNAGAGAAAPFMPGVAGKVGLVGGAALKTMLTPAVRNQAQGNRIMADLADRLPKSIEASGPSDASSEWSTSQKAMAGGALGLGAVGLIAAMLNARKKRQIEEQLANASTQGRVKVTLPTKNPGDAETTIDIPVEEINMSNALRQRLGRDTRRRLYEETKARTRPRKPKNPDSPTEKEQMDLQLMQEMQELKDIEDFDQQQLKAAAQAPAPGMPTPPPPIGNPALRMVQQQQAAGAAPTQTDQNPQIMQAQQQAAAAEQQLQQQQADAQQQVQQAQMDAQAQAQQAQQAQQEQLVQLQHKLNQSQMQQELLKLQVQKAKVEADLHKQMARFKDGTSKAMDAQGKGQVSEAGNLLLSRITRLRGKVVKAAGTAPETEPEAPYAPYKPLSRFGNAVDKLNKDPSAISRGVLHRASAARKSYGGVGDWVYNNFLRTYNQKPRIGQPGGPEMPLPALMAMNSRDIMGTIGSFASGADDMRQRLMAQQGQYMPAV